jgi:S-adenosylmethionine-diacylgycerolhomoserine-N-methlytransferase
LKNNLSTNKETQKEDMRNFYAFQAKIYDFTRWTFLYGRNTILKKLPLDRFKPLEILEVGCGTGVNMLQIAKMYPNAKITGLDISNDMLKVAEKNLEKYKDRITLLEKPYEKGDEYKGKFDLILYSYALTMINPHWDELVAQTPHDLKPDGMVAVVDFHEANYDFYRNFMRSSHVRLDGHILPVLNESFAPIISEVHTGLAGVWNYMMFIGLKK